MWKVHPESRIHSSEDLVNAELHKVDAELDDANAELVAADTELVDAIAASDDVDDAAFVEANADDSET